MDPTTLKQPETAASVAPSTFSASTYFETQPAPPSLQKDVESVAEFVKRHAKEGRRVVLVTSGGTTVPLELNVVRFLDNFSAGTRGSTSAEYFLEAGYAVIFMHRQFSLQPFSRHYSHSTNPFLDLLEIEDHPDSSNSNSSASTTATSSSTSASPDIRITPSKRSNLLKVLKAYKDVQATGTLHTLTFVTVNDYLWLLRAVSQEMACLGRNALYYLAAAVSDFFLPTQKLSEHKIQSGKGSLVVEMDQVPKILKPMVDEWSPEGFIVSFKLETDPELIIPKARTALLRYGHQAVIGNDLDRRKFQVVFVSKSSSGTLASTSAAGGPQSYDSIEESWLRLNEDDVLNGREIEEVIVAELVQRHTRWIAQRTAL